MQAYVLDFADTYSAYPQQDGQSHSAVVR